MVDRYADAVRARRAELRVALAALGGSHRSELRAELAAARLTGSAALAGALRELGAVARERAACGDATVRARLPAEVEAGVAEVGRWAGAVVDAELAPALRRAAGVRELALPPGWPALPPLRCEPAVVRPPAARPPVLAGLLAGMAWWRTAAVSFAALPLVGLPAFGGRALAPLAVGIALAGATAGVAGRRVALERAALRGAVDDALGAAAVALDGALGRRLLELERAVGAELDRAVAQRRAEVDAQLRALAPRALSDPGGAVGGGPGPPGPVFGGGPGPAAAGVVARVGSGSTGASDSDGRGGR